MLQSKFAFTECQCIDEYRVEMAVESELKITNVPWNDSLSDTNSTEFVQLKDQLEAEMDMAFCNSTSSVNDNADCYTEVTGFTEGSINVIFIIIRIEVFKFLPAVDEILADMQIAVATSGGIGNFEVEESSVIVSKFFLLYLKCLDNNWGVGLLSDFLKIFILTPEVE